MLRPFRFIIGSALAVALTISIGDLVYGQQPQQQLAYMPFVLTAERANALADLPMTPDTRARLLALMQQWSGEEQAAEQAVNLQKQLTALKAQVDELQKPKTEEKAPAPKEDSK